jgi:hypothetical protein
MPVFDGPSGGRTAFDAGPAPGRPEGGPRSFEPPMPGTRANPFEAPNRPPVDPGPSFQRPAAFDPAPRMSSNRPGGDRKRVNFTTSLQEEGPTLGRTIANWVAVLAAIAALVYLVRVISTRPDPRKRKLQEESAQEGSGAAPAEGEATGAAAGDPNQ